MILTVQLTSKEFEVMITTLLRVGALGTITTKMIVIYYTINI